MTRRRSIAVWTLVGLASLLLLVCSLVLWVDRQMLDNHAWTKASQDLIQDPQVRSALSVYLVNQLYQNVDVPAALEQRLPDNTKSLAAPVAAALREPAARAVNFMFSRPRVQNTFITASSGAHERLVNVLENKTGYGISTGNGNVTLDLNALVKQLGTELGLPASALAKLPATAGDLTLMKSSQLSAAQQGVNLIRKLSAWLLVLVLFMYAGAVYLARGARRTTLRKVAWAWVLVGLLLLVVRKLVGNYVVGAIAKPGYKHTGDHIWLIWTSILGQIGWAAIFYGVVAVIAVTLAGPTKPARDFRRLVSPVLNDHQSIAWGVVGFAYLLVVLWGGTHALRTWWGILLIGGLLAAGLVALRRQTLAEAAPVPVVAGPPQPHNGPVSQRDKDVARTSAVERK
jgi:hypothetical protein